MQQPEQVIQKVIIRGHVFDYAEKAPFVESGVSVLGAIEYDPQLDLIRCHECGKWCKSVAVHIREHGLTGSEYKIRHGLRRHSGLISMGVKASLSTAVSKTNRRIGNPSKRANTKHHETKASAVRHSQNLELRNERGRCQAQSLFRIQCLAVRLQRTPTMAELDANGLSTSTLSRTFDGISTNKIISMAGLPPNPPVKPQARLNERMPWPKDYFDFSAIALGQKRA